MRELDELLLAFLEQHLDGVPAAERIAFARLLELPDPELLDLLLDRVPVPEPATARVVQLLRHNAPGKHR